MIIRRLLVACALLVSGLGLVAASGASAVAPECEGPGGGNRGKVPACDVIPGDRTFEVTSLEARPGGTIDFTASGFVRDAGGGQTLRFKLNDIDFVGPQLEADVDGNVSGSLTLPDAATFERYRAEYGSNRWWIRVLAGGFREDSASDAPNSSLHDEFTLVDAPALTSAVGGSVNAAGTHLRLALEPGTATVTKVRVKSVRAVRIGRTPRVITIARGTVEPRESARLELTKAGKRYYKTRTTLKVVAVSSAPGADAVTKTFKVKKK